MIWVYVAGPYSSNPVNGTHTAIKTGTALMALGFTPVVPHLTMFWDFLTPMPYERWLAYDIELLRRCDCLLRLPGNSSGADKEVGWALDNGIPVFSDINALLDTYGEAV